MRYTCILITVLVFVGCHQQRYQFENVGTTAAVPVTKTQKNAVQTSPSKEEVEKKIALAEKKIAVKKVNTLVEAKKTNTSLVEDMGTQDSDWIDIVVSQIEQPQARKLKPTKKMPYYLTPEYRNNIENYHHSSK